MLHQPRQPHAPSWHWPHAHLGLRSFPTTTTMNHPLVGQGGPQLGVLPLTTSAVPQLDLDLACRCERDIERARSERRRYPRELKMSQVRIGEHRGMVEDDRKAKSFICFVASLLLHQPPRPLSPSRATHTRESQRHTLEALCCSIGRERQVREIEIT